jgi:DNA helicase-2/ATP-dependent DNA helicase PcrA
MDDVAALAADMARYESVEAFLSDMALLTNLDSEIEAMAGQEGDALRLSTVHQAKGLEWPVVIVLWACEGMFPSARTLQESDGGEAEERRLFYVAVTRAKDELCFCVPEVRRTREGGVIYSPPSRFIREIPPGYVREVRGGFC